MDSSSILWSSQPPSDIGPSTTIGRMMTSSSDNSTDNGISNVDAFRQHLSDEMAIILLPAILIIGLVMVIGCVGNSLVFYVYLTKFNPSSTRSAILALATFDLIASCISMPGEIVDLRFSYNFQSDVLCKGFRFCTVVVLIASGMTLVVVAVDRYRRICHPMKKQMKAKQAQKWALASFTLAVLFSIPAPIMYGVSSVKTSIKGLDGYECSTDNKYRDHLLPLIYNAVLCLLFLAVFGVMIVLYILLGRQVLRQRKFRLRVKRTFSQEETEHSITDGSKDSKNDEAVSPVPDVVLDTSNDISKEEKTCNTEEKEKRKESIPRRKMSTIFLKGKFSYGDARTRKTTLMLFIITAVFVVSFLPHLILKGIQAAKKDFLDNKSDNDIVSYNTFVRSYFFNSVANCFIYGFCSLKFRRECKKVFLKIFCCTK